MARKPATTASRWIEFREVVVAVDGQWLRVRRSLEEKLGMEEASYLMDRPVGGWSALVTNHTLDLKFDVLDARFHGVDAQFASIDQRFEAIDHRFELIDHRFELIDQRFELVDRRFASLEGLLGARFEALEHKLTSVIDQRIRVQTWTTITALFAAVGMLGAFIKL